MIPTKKRDGFGCNTRIFSSLKHATECVRWVRVLYHSTIKNMMIESEGEGFETCSGSSRQKTDATTVATEFDILTNYLISTYKPLERFNPDDEFEESRELGAGNDYDYDAEDLDDHVMDPRDL